MSDYQFIKTKLCGQCGNPFEYFIAPTNFQAPDICFRCQRLNSGIKVKGPKKEITIKEKIKKVTEEKTKEELKLFLEQVKIGQGIEKELIEYEDRKRQDNQKRWEQSKAFRVELDTIIQRNKPIKGVSLRLTAKYGDIKNIVLKVRNENEQRKRKAP